MMLKQTLLFLHLVALVAAWLPRDTGYFMRDVDPSASIISDGKRTFAGKRQIFSTEIRGVNLGSMFIVEPWMASNEWSTMGCGSAQSEFDCVMQIGQERANAAWEKHWQTWITASDLDTMKSYGLNTIRIPVGYWIYEDLVDSSSEHFPQGGLQYLDSIVGAASDRNMYVILDLHGAPGAQVSQQPFTGQYAPSVGFYNSFDMQRATKFLSWITNRIHTNSAYRGVGTLEVLNEPSNNGQLVTDYYPAAMNAVRDAESALGILPITGLHVMMMDERWGSGNPVQDIGNLLTNAAYDDHRYVKYDTSVAPNQQAYLQASCNDNVAGNWPLVVGEWSLSPADEDSAEFDKDTQQAFYTKWFAAQIHAYEQQDGWVFWSWKTDLEDYRWDYQLAVQKGVIPKDPTEALNSGVCNGI